MNRKTHDLTVKVREYKDRNGETKAQWLTVGALFDGPKGPYILLDRTFNPAGLPDPEQRGNVLVSCFEPRDRDAPKAGGGYPSDGKPSRGGGRRPDDLDDDIPFHMEWRV